MNGNPSPVVFAVPGRIDARTGGSIYDRRIAEGLRQHGWSVDVVELDATFPFPTARALAEAGECLASIPDDAIAVVDGLALGAMPDQIERTASRLRVVALVHLPLAAEPGLDPEVAARVEADERRALVASSSVIVTGTATLPMLARYELPLDRIVVVEPGTDRQPLARGSNVGPIRLLSVATLNPGKGHELLVRALAGIADLDWRLTCAGSLTRHAFTVDRVRATMMTCGLQERIELVGEVDAVHLEEYYDLSDVFVLATLQETYGMAVAEALAHGLPVVSTETGAIPALVGDSAGVVVPPGNVEALTGALRRVVGDSGVRAQLAEGARRVRERLPSWDRAVDRFGAALMSIHANAR